MFDQEDDCPEEKGSPATQGCPDRDGDGIKDVEDNCPEVFGVAELGGCPLLTEEELIELNALGEKLFFMVDSAKLIGAPTEASIRAMVEILQKDQRIRLLIEGHTSSDGEAEYNLELSKRRDESVRLRLMEEGITPDRLEIIGYGDT